MTSRCYRVAAVDAKNVTTPRHAWLQQWQETLLGVAKYNIMQGCPEPRSRLAGMSRITVTPADNSYTPTITKRK